MSARAELPGENRGPEPAKRSRNLVCLAFAIAVALTVLWFVRHALLIIYAGAVFAVVLKPAVDWLHRRSIRGWRPGRATALLLLVVALCLTIGGLIAIALPSIASNVSDFAKLMSERSGVLRERLHTLPVVRNVNLGDLQPHISGALGKAVQSVSGAAAAILMGSLLTAYFILDGPALLERALSVFPPEPRKRLESTLNRAARRMRHWLAGQAMLMAILAGAAAVTFGLMGLPYFYVLALFAGLANIVPLLGPLATVVVASAVALTQSGWAVLGVIVFYFAYQQVENAFLTPKIMRSQVQLPSATVIIALLIGSELAGIAGALVAVPSAVLAAELIGEYLIYKAP